MSCDPYKDHGGKHCGAKPCVMDTFDVWSSREEEKTGEFVLAERCPSCRSLDTEPFETHIDGTKHCIPCGRIFQ